MTTEELEKLQKLINESNKIVFFGGAGVSTESGVPDFRSKDGLYNQHDIQFDEYDPEYLLSHSCLVDEPEVFFEYYRQKMDTRGVKPNKAHRFLVKLEKAGKLSVVLTQNIDGLHQKAGSKNVCELHGTTRRNYCSECKKEYSEDYIFESTEPVPLCECGGVIRPNVTLFEEQLPEGALEYALDKIEDADLLIIAGTSLKVYPVANVVRYFVGKNVVVINREEIDFSLDGVEELFICGSVGEVFSKLEI